ncbi:MAG TPA: hypothetical protein VIM04_12395 [Candidatus Binatia bacterium]|jgi:hypothetical protein
MERDGAELVNLISGFLRRARKFFTLAGPIRYVRKKNITNSQRQLQKLKAQVDELSQRLRSLETMTTAVEVELSGPGPFCLPLLSQFKSLLTEVEEQLVLEFQLEDGNHIYARIPYLAAAQFLNGDVSLPLQGVTVSPSTSIDLGRTDAYRLPLLSRYEGHFYAGRDLRVSVFLTQEGLRVFFPLSTAIYEKLLHQLEAVLVSHRESHSSEIGLGVRFPVRYPIRSRW